MEQDNQSTEQVKIVRNPQGSGGFGDNPQNINAGGRPKNSESFVYWYRVFKDMSVAELKDWQINNPEDSRTVASDLAFTRVINAKKDLKEFQEVANRSEGMPKQTTEMSGVDGSPIVLDVRNTLEKIYGSSGKMPIDSKE